MEENLETTKVAVMRKISEELLHDVKYQAEMTGDDVTVGLANEFLSAKVYSLMAEERILLYTCPKPSFFDWLFRREKTVYFELKIKDLVGLPEKRQGSERIYEVRLKK